MFSLSSPGRGKSSVARKLLEGGTVRGKIAAREKVETRSCVARRETGVVFDEHA